MQDLLQDSARNYLKTNLLKLPSGWQMKFKRMYSSDDLDADIDDVVDVIPEDKLDWAMEQVQNSIEKLSKTGEKV